MTLVLGAVLTTLRDVFPELRSHSAFRTSDTLLQLNCVINPILYCYRDRLFRNAVLELLRLRKPQPIQVRKPQPIQPTVGAARFRRRKYRSGSVKNVQLELQTEENRPRLTRSASWDPHMGFVAQRHPHEMTLKRSTSAPLLVDKPTVLGTFSLPLEQHASVVVTSAVIPAEKNIRYRERKFSNPDSLRGDVHSSNGMARIKSPRSKSNASHVNYRKRGLVKGKKLRHASQLTRLIWMEPVTSLMTVLYETVD